ncbi:hypothetical protein RhiirA5_421390 [Rhizophagus irregularis]|uniref:Uncharacterized protein n=1 Tax=Rhizophagus irregularis TaxID=588596 RepID=A0A2I1DTZ6_9GLOM|nr:hypothetical protein RhiirA5_421390 [Rhizophagus irregularis]PKY13342.1 hypothetical protein RhiirB3_425161 [Rhizophagus irregularis]
MNMTNYSTKLSAYRRNKVKFEAESNRDGESTDSDENEAESNEYEENTDSDENGDTEGYTDLVEVELPYKIQNMDVLKTIHNVFKAERINDILIFKVIKVDVHLALQSSIQQQK